MGDIPVLSRYGAIMSYSIRVLNAGASAEVGELKNIVNAQVYEVINDQYTADVEIAENKFPAFLQYPNLLEIEGDYFLIAGIDKQRNNSKSIRLNLEHISYLLNDPFGAPQTVEGEEEIYEGSPGDILSRVWGLGAFQIVDLAGGYYEYRTSTKGGRSRINEFARQNGLEVEYKRFSVIIHNRRGGDNGLVLEVGKNIESIQQKIDLNDKFSLEYAHEVEIIDFAKMTGAQKQDIASAELGDTVTMIDTDLAIHAVERIVGKRYNPLFKETPQLDVGQIIRDFVNYEEEKEEEEKEEENKSLLAQFKVGKIDCLALDDNIDAKNAVLDYLKDTSLQGVIPSTDVELTESQTGVIASLKPDFSSYKLTAIITTETESGLDTDFYELPNSAISSLVLPQQNVSVSVTLVVTKVPFADLVNGKVPIVEDGENATFLEAYGVRFLINDSADGFLEDFKVGTVDVLSFDDIECTSVVVSYIKGQNPNPHASWEQETGKLKGVYASLKEQYKNHHLTFIHTKVVEGKATTEFRKMPFANGRIMEIPTAKDDSVIMVVTKEPFESLTTANVDGAFIKAFGVRFKAAREIFLEEFKIGETDYLLDEGIEVAKDELATIKTEIEYAEADEFTGLFLKLKNAYSDYEISIKEYTASGSTVYPYTDAYKTKKLPGNLVALSVTVSKSTETQIFAVKFKKSDTPGDNDYWLSEFRIGDVDCLELPGVQMESPDSEYIAEIEYESERQYQGLFLSLKEEYADATVQVVLYTEEMAFPPGDYEEAKEMLQSMTFPRSDMMPSKIRKIIFIVTKEEESKYYGVEFVGKEPEIIESTNNLVFFGEDYLMFPANEQIKVDMGSLTINEGDLLVGLSLPYSGYNPGASEKFVEISLLLELVNPINNWSVKIANEEESRYINSDTSVIFGSLKCMNGFSKEEVRGILDYLETNTLDVVLYVTVSQTLNLDYVETHFLSSDRKYLNVWFKGNVEGESSGYYEFGSGGSS